jgi:hypothetical protein
VVDYGDIVLPNMLWIVMDCRNPLWTSHFLPPSYVPAAIPFRLPYPLPTTAADANSVVYATSNFQDPAATKVAIQQPPFTLWLFNIAMENHHF